MDESISLFALNSGYSSYHQPFKVQFNPFVRVHHHLQPVSQCDVTVIIWWMCHYGFLWVTAPEKDIGFDHLCAILHANDKKEQFSTQSNNIPHFHSSTVIMQCLVPFAAFNIQTQRRYLRSLTGNLILSTVLHSTQQLTSQLLGCTSRDRRFRRRLTIVHGF